MIKQIFLYLCLVSVFLSACARKQNTSLQQTADTNSQISSMEQKTVPSPIRVAMSPWGHVQISLHNKKTRSLLSLISGSEKILSYHPDSLGNMIMIEIVLAMTLDISQDGFQDLTLLIAGNGPEGSTLRVSSLLHDRNRGLYQDPEWDKWASDRLAREPGTPKTEYLRLHLSDMASEYRKENSFRKSPNI